MREFPRLELERFADVSPTSKTTAEGETLDKFSPPLSGSLAPGGIFRHKFPTRNYEREGVKAEAEGGTLPPTFAVVWRWIRKQSYGQNLSFGASFRVPR